MTWIGDVVTKSKDCPRPTGVSLQKDVYNFVNSEIANEPVV